MHSYSYVSKVSNLKYGIQGFYGKNKTQIFVLSFFALLGLLTGIFTAIKCGVNSVTLHNYNLTIYCNSTLFSFDVFFSRMLSHVCMLVILTISSLHIAVIPIGYLIHTYRTYLIGFNCTILVLSFGFSGMFTSILIIFPCQLLVTFVFIIFYSLMISRMLQKRRFGNCGRSHFLKIFFIFLLILTILNAIECLLLMLLSAKTILVI